MKNTALFFLFLAAAAAAAGQNLDAYAPSSAQQTAGSQAAPNIYPTTRVGVQDGKTGKFMYDTSLMRSVKVQDADSVKTLLRAHINPNEKNYENVAPLYKAAELGNPEIVKLLIDAGAVVNEPGNYAITPLMAASAGGHSTAVKYLLESGADITMRDKLGKTAVLHAGTGGDAITFKYLFQADANIEDKDKAGETPLIIALQAKNDAGAADLIKRGADLSAASEGMTAQTMANAFGPGTLTKKALTKRLKQEAKGNFNPVTENVVIQSGVTGANAVVPGTASKPVVYGELSGNTADTPHKQFQPALGLVIEHK